MQFTPRDQVHLIHAAKAGNAGAMEALIREHEELIGWIASRYAGQGGSRSQNLEDLRQDATLAFMRAVHGFDLSAGTRLQSYARTAMENACKDAARRYFFPFSVPANANDCRLACYRVERELQEEIGREPTAAEIGAEVGLCAAEVEQAMTLPAVVELDRPLGLGGDGPRYPEIPVTDDRAVGILLWRALLKPCVSLLPPPERVVISKVFGLEGEPVEQQQIAAELGVNAMMVSRIKARALRHLHGMIGGEAAL